MSKSRTNEEWLRELQSKDAEQAAAIADLRAMLLRAALYSLNHINAGLGHLGRDEIEQLAEDCAQDALLAVLKHLREFRGDSRFTTWAYKFAVNFALVTARRERGKNVSLDTLLENSDLPEWPIKEERAANNPDRAAQQEEIWATMREVIEREMTERQWQAIKAIIFDDVPMDELVRHWKTNRNAIYKLLHDARRKLKSHLEARGYAMEEILDLFSKKG